MFLTTLTLDHVNFYRAHDGVVAGWASIVKSTLPTVTSLSFRNPGAFSTEEPFDDAEEHRAFTELAAVLESLRQDIQHINIGITRVSHGCMMYLTYPEKPFHPRKTSRIWFCLRGLALYITFLTGLYRLVKGIWPSLVSITLEGLWIPTTLRDQCPAGS